VSAEQKSQPDLTRGEIEQNLRDYLVRKNDLWLGEGSWVMTPTGTSMIHPSIKWTALSRAWKRMAATQIIACSKKTSSASNVQGSVGKKFDLVTLPMPKAFAFQGQRLRRVMQIS